MRTAATRYAKALFDVALREADPAAVEDALSAVVGAMSEHRDLHRAMTSPGIPAAARMGVMRAMGDALGAPPPLAKLLVMMAERGRLELLPALLDVYRERLLAHRQVVRATVVSATPLTASRVEVLAQGLGELTGKHVAIEATVDPSLLGGVVARIGSTVYDGSIRTQLEKMRQRLVETG
ncbi:MAG: ATP synthase F1 subunit delta [Acidobacteriota bacterium]